MITFERVTQRYGERTALQGVTVRVAPKECVCIAGPAHAGKSTMLRLLLRAEKPTLGRVLMDNVDLEILPPVVLRLYRHRIGLKLQEGNLFLHRTVAKNLAAPLKIQGWHDRDTARAVRAILERLGLRACADAFPGTLPQESQTILGLGRALIGNPMILLLDDPFADLSLTHLDLALSLLREAHAHGKTVIVWTRDDAMADALRARLIHIEGGKVLEDRPYQEKEEESSTSALPPTMHHIFAKILLARRPQAAQEERVRKVEIVAGG